MEITLKEIIFKMWRTKRKPAAEALPITQSFATLFYFCKMFGFLPFDFQTFRKRKELLPSKLGSVIVTVTAVLLTITLYLSMGYVSTDYNTLVNQRRSKI